MLIYFLFFSIVLLEKTLSLGSIVDTSFCRSKVMSVTDTVRLGGSGKGLGSSSHRHLCGRTQGTCPVGIRFSSFKHCTFPLQLILFSFVLIDCTFSPIVVSRVSVIFPLFSYTTCR